MKIDGLSVSKGGSTKSSVNEKKNLNDILVNLRKTEEAKELKNINEKEYD